MSVGLLDFFILEASDYVERLDALVADAGDGGPDAAELVKLARGLRGSATMAKVNGIAEVAAAVERAGRELQAGRTPWTPALAGALVGAVDDLKILLHGVRSWGAEETARAQARAGAIAATVSTAPEPGATPTYASSGAGFVAARAAEIAGALDALVAAPGDSAAAAELLRQVRALRGVAAVKDVPTVAEVVAAVERAAQPLELGEAHVTPERRSLFTAAAALLRRAGDDAAGGAGGDEAQRFAAAVAALDAEPPADAHRVVPIAELAPDGDESVVVRGPNPPTTPARRFGLEVVSQAEHLRRLRADAAAASDPIGRERVAQELRRSLRALHDSAVSFGEHAVARVASELGAAVAALASDALDAVERLAAVLASPTDSPDERARHVGALRPAAPPAPGTATTAPTPPSSSTAAVAPRATPTPAATPTPPVTPPVQPPATSEPTVSAPTGGSGAAPSGGWPLRGVSQTPTGRELHALLEDSIAGISRLDDQPLDGSARSAAPAASAGGGGGATPPRAAAPVAAPAPAITAAAAITPPAAEPPTGAAAPAPETSDDRPGDEQVVPIETLLYRGPSALRRARELRDELRTASAGRRLPDALAELFELLDLAAAE